MTERKKHLSTLVRIGVTAVLLVIIAFTVDLSQVWQVVRQAKWLYLALAWLLYQLGILVRSFRWQELLRLNGIKIPFAKLIELYYVGTFFNNFLPTGFGGDVVKMVELSHAGTDSELAVSTVLADRLIGLAMLLLMALLVLPFGFRLVPTSVILVLLAIILGFAVGMGLLMSRSFIAYISRWNLIGKQLARPKIASFLASFRNYHFRSLGKAWLASLLFNLLLIVVYILLGRAAGVDINPIYFFLFIPIISTLTVLPISVSGLGVREGSYVLLFGKAGVATSQALAMSLLFYALNVVTGLTGGIIYLIQNIRSTRVHNTTD
ncbi:MAG: flippase-like domain-containing protein [Chloroflexi bacterium]|nr:flippase-like domain-containing protein [Chloroflexota bacterium]